MQEGFPQKKCLCLSAHGQNNCGFPKCFPGGGVEKRRGLRHFYSNETRVVSKTIPAKNDLFGFDSVDKIGEQKPIQN